MTWFEFNTSLSPLIKRFGSYSQDEIKRGFYHWKTKHQNELIEEISIAVSIGKRLDLCPVQIVDSKVNIDTKNKWKDELESRVITDNYMDKLIKDSNCSSLLDLVFKNKK